MKRLVDVVLGTILSVLTLPIILTLCVAIWISDRHSPFYVSSRIGLNGRPFKMIKLRTMVVGADTTGVDSTAAGDPRITRIGHFLRRYKIDEITQLWNVVLGHMTFVGPRPNVEREVRLYSAEERLTLSVRPGVTDLASIVFSDLADLLSGLPDPNLSYNQLVRPWKSRLAIFYVQNRTGTMDLRIVLLTLVSVLNRERALDRVARLLQSRGASATLVAAARRSKPLEPTPPPGVDKIVMSREV